MKITITITIEGEEGEEGDQDAFPGLDRHGKRWRFRVTPESGASQQWIFVPDRYQDPEEAFAWMKKYKANRGYPDGRGAPRTVPEASLVPGESPE